MKLQHIFEEPENEKDPAFVAAVQQDITDNYIPVESLFDDEKMIPLEPTYDRSKATQEDIQAWYGVLCVNDTPIDDYAIALQQAQKYVVAYFDKHGDDFIAADAGNTLAQIANSLGDRFTISSLEKANQQWAQVAATHTYSMDDIESNPEIASQFADDRDAMADPAAYRGVRNSDFG